ncbi:unnamed protein product [Prunus armeniaca]
MDNNDIRRGENIADELKQAIERSRICVIVFSNGYAYSKWCLDELEKIMESKRTRQGPMVLPIFYDVDPEDVKKQTGSFEKAFQKHELCCNGDEDKVQRWRSACTEAAKLAGLNLRNTDGREGQFIRKILGEITRTLKNTSLHVATNPIGIDSRVKEVSNYLRVGGSDHDVRIIGILGMGGTGKTTIAKAIFNEFSQSFQGYSFLSEVRKGDMVELQNQLICDILKPAKIEVRSVDEGTRKIKDELGNRKVLVIFDDIDCEELNKLAIKHESFGLGSRIIVTTRNERVLKMLEVDETYLVPPMSEEEAFQLLRCRAFTEHHPSDEVYLKLLSRVVKYCNGLPLALEVLGSYLCTRTKNEWISALKKLKRKPHGKIHEILKISYEGLIDNEVKAIFLDISCFFIGMNKDYVKTILDGCDFDTEIGIGELHDQCLVSVDEKNNLEMHNLLRDMGREIVREESPSIIGKRSRLWNPEDVTDVLRNESGTAEIEGVTLDLQGSHEPSFSAEALKNMQGLRLLKLKGAKFTGDCKGLSKKLRLLCWPEFPLEAIPEDFNPPNIVDIDLSRGHIQVWKDSDMPLEKLKFLNLGYCDRLKQSPDFSKLPNLEKLILQGCNSLSEIHHSILQLKTLEYLCLADCNLTDEAIPEDLGDLISLKELDLRGNVFYGLPTLSRLSRLQSLQLTNCANLRAIPDLPTNLEILQADECIALEEMPNFSRMLCMRELHLNRSPKLTEIPGLDKSYISAHSLSWFPDKLTKDYLELDDDDNSEVETVLTDKSSVATATVTLEKPPAFSALSDESMLAENGANSTGTSVSSYSKMVSTQPSFTYDKVAPPEVSIAGPSMVNFWGKVPSMKDSNAASPVFNYVSKSVDEVAQPQFAFVSSPAVGESVDVKSGSFSVPKPESSSRSV